MSMNSILTILKEGPCQSSKLKNLLINKEGISDDAARKRLSRLSSPIARVSGLSLEKNEVIYYLEEQRNSSLFKDSLRKILEDSNTAEGRVIRAIGLAGQTIPLSYLAKSSGTTFVDKSPKHVFINKVLERLLNLGLIEKLEDSKYSILVAPSGWELMKADVRANFEIEDIYLSMIKSWLIKLGICSTKSISIRNDETCRQYGMFEWDLMGPSYLNGFLGKRIKNYKISFIVGDIVLGRKISQRDLKPFLYKIDALNQQKTIQPFQPIFIADYFESDALGALRNKGVLIATPSNVFDQEVAKLLRSLKDVLTKAFISYKKTPKDVFKIISKINKIEGASLNLRGIFLDFVAARIYNHEGFQCDIRKRFRLSDGTMFEFDVVANNRDCNVFIEGKALSSGNLLSAADIQDWYKKTFPRLMKWIKEEGNPSEKNIVEFWVSTAYHPECEPIISDIKKHCRKVQIEFRDNQFIVDQLKKYKDQSIVDSFNEQFKN